MADRGDADRGNDDDRRNSQDVAEIARLHQRVRDLELQCGGYEDKTDTNFVIRDNKEVDGNPFGRQNRRREAYDYDPLRSMGIKVEIPKFDGIAQSDKFIDWLSTVEQIFDLKEIPDKYKVKFVASKLRKYASLWWDHVKNKRAQKGKSKVKTWDKMKKILREKFLPINYRQEAFLEYHNLSQRSSSVEDMIAEFDRL